MRWSDLVTAGHITWHLNHRYLAQALGRQDMRLSAADPTALRAGRLVLEGQDVGLAQPLMTLAPQASMGQWWWASAASDSDSTKVVNALRAADGDCDVLVQPTVAFSALTGVQKATPSQAAEAVCAAATALLRGPRFTAIPVGQSIIVTAVQVPSLGSTPEFTDEAIIQCAQSLSWTPGPTDREVQGAQHLLNPTGR